MESDGVGREVLLLAGSALGYVMREVSPPWARVHALFLGGMRGSGQRGGCW